MSFGFSIPVLYSIGLIIHYINKNLDELLNKQLKNILIGIFFATVVSVISEYIIPSFTDINHNFSLMYISIFIFVLFSFIGITKHSFLHIEAEYIYQKMFHDSNVGIMLINDEDEILNINKIATNILKQLSSKSSMKISTYIDTYNFEENYDKREFEVSTENDNIYFKLSQSPISVGKNRSAKLLHIVDVTSDKNAAIKEREQLIKKSHIDDLTGLYNKRFLSDNFALDKSDSNYSVIFIDVDNFKQINDKFGHDVGDDVLKKTAVEITDSLRSDEKAIRYGGDEFVILLRKTTISNALKISKRIQEAIRNNDISKNTAVTISVGISEGKDNIYELIKMADTAMYQAKIGGKNKIKVFSYD